MSVLALDLYTIDAKVDFSNFHSLFDVKIYCFDQGTKSSSSSILTICFAKLSFISLCRGIGCDFFVFGF
jgi:hypothetical protein